MTDVVVTSDTRQPYTCFVQTDGALQSRMHETLSRMFNQEGQEPRVFNLPDPTLYHHTVMVTQVGNPLKELIEPVRTSFLRKHVSRIVVTKELGEEPKVTQDTIIAKLKEQAPGDSYRLQTFPMTTERHWAEEHVPGISCSPSLFTHVAAFCRVASTWYFALTPACWHYKRPELKSAGERPEYCRASWKLEEVNDIHPFLQDKWVANDLAVRQPVLLDIGAAPGGWSRYVAGYGWRVTAVDPSPMPLCTGVSEVTHLQGKAQDVMDDIARLGPYDMLVCDVNRHVDEVIPDIVFPAIAQCRPGALVVVTFKFMNKKPGMYGPTFLKHTETQIAQKLELLEQRVADVSCHWLLQNTSHERTAIGRVPRSR